MYKIEYSRTVNGNSFESTYLATSYDTRAAKLALFPSLSCLLDSQYSYMIMKGVRMASQGRWHACKLANTEGREGLGMRLPQDGCKGHKNYDKADAEVTKLQF